MFIIWDSNVHKMRQNDNLMLNPLLHCHTIPLLHRHTVTLFHYPTITLSHYPTIPLSHYHTIPLSHCHNIPLYHHHTITLSHCHISKFHMILVESGWGNRQEIFKIVCRSYYVTRWCATVANMPTWNARDPCLISVQA